MEEIIRQRDISSGIEVTASPSDMLATLKLDQAKILRMPKGVERTTLLNNNTARLQEVYQKIAPETDKPVKEAGFISDMNQAEERSKRESSWEDLDRVNPGIVEAINNPLYSKKQAEVLGAVFQKIHFGQKVNHRFLESIPVKEATELLGMISSAKTKSSKVKQALSEAAVILRAVTLLDRD